MAVKAHCMVVARDPTTGASLLSATVNVYNPGTVTPISATIFDKNNNVLSNPLTSDPTTGLIDFYLTVAQEVDLVVAKAGFTTRTYSNVPVLDDASLDLSALLTTTGDMAYASSANTPARLAIGSANQALIASGGIPAWSAIGSASLAANAVSAFTIANPSSTLTTTSATLVTLEGFTVTIQGSGTDLLIWYSANLSSSSSSAILTLAININGGADTNLLRATVPAANAWVPMSLVYRFTSVANGSNTVNIRWATSAGTATTDSSVFRTFLGAEFKH